MEAIYVWIKNIVIYMILNTIIMNLLGNSSYKKYVSIISGMLLVLIVISPLINLLRIEDKLDGFFQSNNFAIETSDFKNSILHVEQQQRDIIFGEYKNKINTQVERILKSEGLTLVKLEIHFDMNVDSNHFGEIQRMDIKAGYEREITKARDNQLIDQITISRIEINSKEEKEVFSKIPSPVEINIKNRLSDFYNMEQDNINISIQGG